MRNADVRYRYYDYFNPPNDIKIAFSDKIRLGFFRDVLSYGVHIITEDLNIPEYDNVEDHGHGFWIFSGEDKDFKVNWQFNGNTPYSLTIRYYVDDNELDNKTLYDFTTYEEALDFIQDYMRDILTNGVSEEPQPEYNENDVAELKLMHHIMMSMNNEDAYYSWTMTGVPDGATEEDYIDIASDPEEFTECKHVFDEVFSDYASDGLFDPTSEEAKYAKQVCKRLGLPEIEILGRT